MVGCVDKMNDINRKYKTVNDFNLTTTKHLQMDGIVDGDVFC